MAVWNVQNFGAKGDGRTIDTSAIQAAINAAVSSPPGPGVEVYIPAGNYIIDSTIVVAAGNGITIRGDGQSSILTWKGSYSSSSPAPLLWLQSCLNARVQSLGITVDSAYRLAEGVRLTTNTGVGVISTHCVFDQVGISSTRAEIETCVRIGGAVKDPLFYNVVPGAVNANNDFHSFLNCDFTNYARNAVFIQDDQVFQIYFANCRIGAAGWRTSPSGAMTIGSNTLTFPSDLFDTKDVGKWIEVAGADISAATLRGRIGSILSSTSLSLVDSSGSAVNAGTNVTGATITYGAQCAIFAAAGSFSFNGGAASNNLYSDFYIGAASGGVAAIRDSIFETSRRFIVTGGPAGAVLRKITVENVRFSGDAVVSYEPNAVSVLYGGSLAIMNSTIGDPGRNTPLSVALGVGAGASSGQYNHFSVINSIISSSLATSALFPNDPPNEIINCKHSKPTALILLGNQTRNSANYYNAPVSGAVGLDWGYAHTINVSINGNSTFTFSNMPLGIGTQVRLMVKHVGGPWLMAWPASVNWGNVGAPAGATSGKSDFFEFWYDGTTYYARTIGQGF